jgi:hypothetical protein
VSELSQRIERIRDRLAEQPSGAALTLAVNKLDVLAADVRHAEALYRASQSGQDAADARVEAIWEIVSKFENGDTDNYAQGFVEIMEMFK